MEENLNAVAIKVKGFWTNLRVYNGIDYPREEFTRWIIFMKEPPSILEYSKNNILDRYNLDDVKYKTKIVFGLGIEDDINKNEVALWEIDSGEIPGALKVSQDEYHQQDLSNNQLMQGSFVSAMYDVAKKNLGFAITELIEIKIFSRNNDRQFTIEKRVGKAPNVIFSNMDDGRKVSSAKKRAKRIEEAILNSKPAIRAPFIGSRSGGFYDVIIAIVGLLILFSIVMFWVKLFFIH